MEEEVNEATDTNHLYHLHLIEMLFLIVEQSCKKIYGKVFKLEILKSREYEPLPTLVCISSS